MIKRPFAEGRFFFVTNLTNVNDYDVKSMSTGEEVDCNLLDSGLYC